MMKFNSDMLTAYLVGGTQDVHDADVFLPKVEGLMNAGITAFQLREKGGSQLTKSEVEELAKDCRELATRYHVPFIIDDDYELATLVKADGVHVGQKDRRITEVIAAVSDQMFIGYSCNTRTEIEASNQLAEVAYIGSGPIYPTGSKADADPAIGIDGLAELVKVSQKPIVAIGGINEDAVPAIMQTGVAGISAISMFLQSKNIAQTVQKVLKSK